jgi:hypothetical protein
MKTELLAGIIALVAIAAATLYHGKKSDRWGQTTSERLDDFTNRLKDVPIQIGDWVGTDTEVDQEQFKQTHCTGCVQRLYRNRETGAEVSAYLVSGTARHITIHTPDWCYVAAGFDMEGKPTNYAVDCPTLPANPEFLTTTFIKQDPTNTYRLRIFWSYSDDGKWEGPKWAKPAYAGKPALYKLYMIVTLPEGGRPLNEDPAVEFAKQLMPVLNSVLFPPAAQAPANPPEAKSAGDA